MIIQMLWSELYKDGQKPSENQIREFVATDLWDDLAAYLRQTYHVEPSLFYSGCSMDMGAWKGWNVKYKKSGKALCTLYPKQGHFTALINVGAKEAAEAELLIPLCDGHTQDVYHQSKTGVSGKSLGINVTSESILSDVKKLIALRASPVIATATNNGNG